MAFTNSLVQVVCNATLQTWGGDIYVGVMTVLNSVRDIFHHAGPWALLQVLLRS